MCSKFKHCSLLAPLSPKCPPADAHPDDHAPAFHFVHDPLGHKENFLPARVKQPKRKFRPDQLCPASGLSMWQTAEHARARYDELRAMITNVGLIVGTHLAGGTLARADGIRTAPTANGHYTFFESVEFDPVASFRIIEAL